MATLSFIIESDLIPFVANPHVSDSSCENGIDPTSCALSGTVTPVGKEEVEKLSNGRRKIHRGSMK